MAKPDNQKLVRILPAGCVSKAIFDYGADKSKSAFWVGLRGMVLGHAENFRGCGSVFSVLLFYANGYGDGGRAAGVAES